MNGQNRYINVSDSPVFYSDDFGGQTPPEISQMGTVSGNSSAVAKLMAATAGQMGQIGYVGNNTGSSNMNQSMRMGANSLRNRAMVMQQEAMKQKQMEDTQRKLDALMATPTAAPTVNTAPQKPVVQKQPITVQQAPVKTIVKQPVADERVLKVLTAISESINQLNGNILGIYQLLNERIPAYQEQQYPQEEQYIEVPDGEYHYASEDETMTESSGYEDASLETEEGNPQ